MDRSLKLPLVFALLTFAGLASAQTASLAIAAQGIDPSALVGLILAGSAFLRRRAR